MSEVAGIELDEDLGRVGSVVPIVDSGISHLRDLRPEDAALLQKTNAIASQSMNRMARPKEEFSFLAPNKKSVSLSPNAITQPPENAGNVQLAAATSGVVSGPAPVTFEDSMGPILKTIDPNLLQPLHDAFRNGAAKLAQVQGPGEIPDGDVIRHALEGVGTEKGVNFPNLALEVVQLGLKMEKFQTEERLHKYQQEAQELKGTISSLLKVSARLQKLSADAASHPLTPELKTLIDELKGKGIDLFPDLKGNALTKEELIGAKSLISSHIDQLRMQLQEIFTTKISVAIQFLNTMAEVMKNIIRQVDRLLGTINRHSGGR